MKLKIDSSKFLDGIASHRLKFDRAIEGYAETSAKKLEEKAKKGALWTDRTGLARGTIKGEAERQGSKSVISLSGNMDYSYWLEEARSGKYATIKPTMRENEKDILEGLKILLK